MVQMALNQVRNKNGKKISLYRLRRQTGINHITLKNYDKGRPVTVRLEHIDSLMRALRCKLTDLLIVNGKKP